MTQHKDFERRVCELVSPTWSVQAWAEGAPAAMTSGRVASLFW
jgi:hypothetical protein